MKLLIVAVSVALSALACTGGALAQSSVTVYGLVDLALVRESGAASGAITKVSSGVGAGSRLGFRGSEDLGGGMAAVFLLESGFQADTGASGQGGLLLGRQVYAGLQSPLGTLTIGRQYTPQYLTVVLADPFGSGYAGDSKNLMPATGNGASRMDNSLKYASPLLQGFNAELVYGAGEVSGDGGAGRQLGAALGYAKGPLKLRLGYHDRDNDTAALKHLSRAKNTVLAATWDFGPAKLHFAYGRDRGLNSAPLRNAANPYGYATAPLASTDSRDLLLGVSLPYGQHQWMMSYIRKDDRMAANQDAHQLALGYRYYLSKRTDLYAAVAHISNSNGAGYTVGSAIEGGSGNKAVNLGLRHSF
jgi:predicted porin